MVHRIDLFYQCLFSSDYLKINVCVMSTQTGVSLYDDKNDGKEAVGVSVTVLLLDISSYDSYFWKYYGCD